MLSIMRLLRTVAAVAAVDVGVIPETVETALTATAMRDNGQQMVISHGSTSGSTVDAQQRYNTCAILIATVGENPQHASALAIMRFFPSLLHQIS